MKQLFIKITSFIKSFPKKMALLIIAFLILILLLIPSPGSKKIQLVSISPSITRPIPDQITIDANFNKSLTPDQKQNLKLETSPEFKATFTWTDNNQLKIIPQQALEPNTTYKATLFYNNESLNSTSFTTNPFSTKELEEQSKLQQSDDLIHAKAIENIHQQYPWYSQIPISTQDYLIVFDFEKTTFRVHLLTESTEAIKQQALTQIQDIGANISSYGFYFIENQ